MSRVDAQCGDYGNKHIKHALFQFTPWNLTPVVKITEGHAKAILSVENPEKQRALFELIIKNHLTVRQVEGKTQEISVRGYKRSTHQDPELKEIEDRLVGILGTKVKLSKSGDGGKIIIEYYSKEELENLINKFS